MDRSLAIAYQMKRKEKKACYGGNMASGGTVKSGDPDMNYADGGFIGSHESPCTEKCNHPGMPHEQASGYVEETHPVRMPNDQGLTKSGLQDSSHMMDMVGRAMMKRKMMSKGGQVANDTQEITEGMPARFDDLVLRGEAQEFQDTGISSGDEIGPAEEDDGGEQKRRDDLVMRAMMKRKAKK